MKPDENIISINILDRSYKVKCPAEEVQQLQAAARYLDEQMRKTRHATNTISTDRLAVICALNVCHELLLLKQHKDQRFDLINERIQDLQKRIENRLASQEEIAL